MTADTRPGPLRPGLSDQISALVGGQPLKQLGLLVGVVLLFAFLAGNTASSMARLGIQPGFGFLFSAANFAIGESPIPYAAGDSYGRAILVGLLNTVLVAAWGCVLATVIGVAFGIARLSGNMLLAGLVQGYVEVVRNTPLLLQLIFWGVTIRALPGPRQALQPLPGTFLTNRGVYLPGLEGAASSVIVALALAALVTALVAVTRSDLDKRRRARLAAAALAVAAGATAFAGLASGHLGATTPALKGFNITGGASLSPEFATLLIGLVVNSSAGISEIVRSGLQSVAKGQWEAGLSTGLHRGQVLRLIVLPQAMRVITPMLTSSYLDLTKNSSLAVAIGFPDLVSIANTTANTTGQSTEALAIVVGVYLVLNLGVSAFMNHYNRVSAMRGLQPR